MAKLDQISFLNLSYDGFKKQNHEFIVEFKLFVEKLQKSRTQSYAL